MSYEIRARRVDGDAYTCTSSHTSLADTMSWDEICALADQDRVDTVTVNNAYRGEGELDEIVYKPTPKDPLSRMKRPSTVRRSPVTRAEPLPGEAR